MKIAFIGDLHLGNHRQYGGELKQGMNERFHMTLRALRRALAWADEGGCTDVVIAGDVFDTPKPLPQQLTAVREALLETPSAKHLILGNHDRVSDLRGDHGLGPLGLEDMGDGVMVYDRPAVIGDSTCQLLLCPFDARPVKEWLEPLLVSVFPQTGHVGERLVCGHFGLYERAQASSQPWLTNANDAIEVDDVARLLAIHHVKGLYVGNYHTHFRWTIHGVQLHQLGALVPTGFDNPGFHYGRVETWPEDETTVVGGPRFVVVSSGDELGKEAARAEREGCVLYADWRVSPEVYEATLQAAASGWDPIDGKRSLPPGSVVEVHVDRKFSKLRAAEAAGAARSSATLIESVHAFVSRAELPPHVSRDAVLEHVRRFLGC